VTPRGSSRARSDVFLLLLLAALPVIAYAPAWTDARLLGPGDGTFLHFPLRAAVWEAYRNGDLPGWNPGLFLGTPLLAAYRPGAFYPLMAPLAALTDFDAFQVLVLVSLSAAAVLTFLYVRRLGGERVGAFVAGTCFSLGPYLVGHLGDTATVVAAPLLLLVLLAAEAHMNVGSPARAAGLAGALALLFLAGSPEASKAGAALVAGRLLVGHALLRAPRGPRVRDSLLAVAAALGLAAPQLLPSLLLAAEAGRNVTGLAPSAPVLPGFFGLVLRYASHTPAPALVVAALPLSLSLVPVRVLGIALLICLGLQWGRGPLAAPGALALVFDLTLSVLAGLSLSEQWRARREPQGRRLRAYFLVASLASAAALSVAAAALGPLPQTLAGPVGVLAFALIFYFSMAASPHPLRAAVWLLPLTASFVLQPQGRGAWDAALRRRDLITGSPTRAALEGAMGARRGDRTLTLAREWPRAEQVDVAFGNVGLITARRMANGYDPMTPLSGRLALGGMSVAGVLPSAFFRTDPARLELLGVRWVQLPTSALRQEDVWGDPLDLPLDEGKPRFFPVPITSANEVRVVSSLAEGVDVPSGRPVARVRARLATGRSLTMLLRAGAHTAEWAWDRADVRPVVAHERAPVFEAWPGPGGGFQGLRYLARLPLPGRYVLDGLSVERLPGGGRFRLYRMALYDQALDKLRAVALPAGYVSDAGRFREVAATPNVRLFEVPGAAAARVVENVKVLPTEAAVVQALGALERDGVDVRRTALVVASQADGLDPSAGGRAGPAEVIRAGPRRMDVRAEGPGVLVVSELWERGWKAEVDGAFARVRRLNHAQIGVALSPGVHRVVLRYGVPGLREGVALCGVAVAGLFAWTRGGLRRGPAAPA
jgi:hypothetical protein